MLDPSFLTLCSTVWLTLLLTLVKAALSLDMNKGFNSNYRITIQLAFLTLNSAHLNLNRYWNILLKFEHISHVRFQLNVASFNLLPSEMLYI